MIGDHATREAASALDGLSFLVFQLLLLLREILNLNAACVCFWFLLCVTYLLFLSNVTDLRSDLVTY